MPQPMSPERKARAEKRAARHAERLAMFTAAPLSTARARLDECACPLTFEPPAEFSQDESRALLARLARLEARYRVLYRMVSVSGGGCDALDELEAAHGVKGFLDPDSRENWGRT